jgi:hypothetical protein
MTENLTCSTTCKFGHQCGVHFNLDETSCLEQLKPVTTQVKIDHPLHAVDCQSQPPESIVIRVTPNADHLPLWFLRFSGLNWLPVATITNGSVTYS